MYEKFTAIDLSNKNKLIPEEEFADKVFYSEIRAMGGSSHKENNQFYNKPDYTRHIFKNTNKELYWIDSNNIVLPIRENNTLNNLYSEFKDDKGPTGVYIVERFLMHENINTDTIIQYYLERSLISKSGATFTKIYNLLHNSLYQTSVRMPVVIRLVTFIPISEIVELKTLYVTNVNIGIINGKPKKNVEHPLSVGSRLEDIKEKLNNETFTNLIGIEIINNENPNKPYFIKIGKNVVRLHSVTSSIYNTSANIVIKKDGIISYEKKIENLQDLMMSGIYETKELAECDGDLDSHIEVLKVKATREKIQDDKKKREIELERENSKLALELEKISKEKQKMELELESLKTAKIISERKFNTEMEKLNAEIERLKSDNKIKLKEFEINSIKGIDDELKRREDLAMLKAKNAVELEKIKFERKQYKLELERKENELEVLKEKNKLEIEKLKSEKVRLEHDVKNYKLKMEQFETESKKYKLDLEKHKLELEKLKKELEKLEIDKDKNNIEKEKLLLSKRKLEFEILDARRGYTEKLLRMEMELRKYDKDLKKAEIEMSIMKMKSNTEGVKSLSSVIGDLRKILGF